MVSKVTYKLNIRDLIGDSDSDLTDAAGQFLGERIKEYCAKSTSPVSGGDWKKTLSKAYKELKENATGRGSADMDLTGEMLEALSYVNSRDTVEIGIFEGSQAGKADGHNNHSGKSKLPERKFIPEKDEDFKRNIIAALKEYLQDVLDSRKQDEQ
jgi:hypothetical protein